MKKTVLLISVIIISILALAGCQPPKTANTANTNTNTETGKVPSSGGECTQGDAEPPTAINSPTEAYSFLFESVKKGDTEAIKQVSSRASRELAQFMSSNYKKTCAEAYKNGFTETTMQEKMPETRDLRTEGDVAMLEVKRPDGKWDDVPFVREGNGWKVAFGDLFFGKIKSPGKPQSVREQENANARGVNVITVGNTNGNTFKADPVPDEKIEKPLQRPRSGQAPPPPPPPPAQ